MLLSIGLHPSDAQYQDWIDSLPNKYRAKNTNSDSKENEDTVQKNESNEITDVSLEDVVKLLLGQSFEASVSLSHYITAYLHFKNSKKFRAKRGSKSKNRPNMNIKSVNSIMDNGWWIRFDRGPLFSADTDDLYVMDRRSQLRMREHVPGYLKIALKLMYDGWLGRISNNNIKQQLNILAANKSCKFDEKSSHSLIEPFVRMHNINMTQFHPSDIGQYKTFNDFFARSLKLSHKRAIPKLTAKDILSPCDGKLICFDQFSDCTSFWVKGSKFNVQRLIGDQMYENLLSNDKTEFDEIKFSIENMASAMQTNRVQYNKMLKEFSSYFSVSIFRLSPFDYHGYHSPFNARVVDITEIDGALYSVSPIVVNRDVNVLTENKRCCILFENEQTFGFCVMIIIASFLVGSYTVNCKIGEDIECGQLIGKFRFGGSSIILLFSKNRIKFDEDLAHNSLLRTRVETVVKLHSHIATCQ